jgi:hypothetical protein
VDRLNAGRPGARTVQMARGDVPFVGRAHERSLFRAALEGRPGAEPVLYVHGPGGIGKSALLRRLASDARAAGRPVVEVGADAVRPDEGGFAHARSRADGGSLVLLVDALDRRPGLDHWLREHFLPGLPLGTVVVLASRRPPALPWVLDPGWARCARITRLPGLGDDEAALLLRRGGLPTGSLAAVTAFADGSPLALTLAVAEPPPDTAHRPLVHWRPSARTVTALLSGLIGPCSTAEQRRMLEVCARVGAVSEEALRTELGVCAQAAFRWLCAQPWALMTEAGVRVDPVVAHTAQAWARHSGPARPPQSSPRLRHLRTHRTRIGVPAAAEPALHVRPLPATPPRRTPRTAAAGV